MDIQMIREGFQDRRPNVIGYENRYAIMVLMTEIDNELNIIFEVRSKNVHRQPGDVCMPGGRVENSEAYQDAAIRECCEELGIDKCDIDVIGRLDYIVDKRGGFIFPFLGVLKNKTINDLKFNENEIERLFTVPVSYFMKNDAELYYMYYRPEFPEDFPIDRIHNGKNYKWGNLKYPMYFYKFQNYNIWGITGIIIYHLIKRLKTIQV